MAFVTTSAEFAFVHVVTAMTIDTSPVGANVAVQGFIVAIIAMNFGMCMPESEFRIIVIETPDQPVVRVVAARTFTAQAALVDIVFTMTVDACRFSVGEYGVEVAGLATKRSMLSYKWKSSQVVVEADPGLPGLVVVALRAILAERTLMYVVLPVTVIAAGFQLQVCGTSNMAGLAFEVRVTAPQRKIGLGVMVEHRQVPAPDLVTIAAFFTVRSFVNVIVLVAAVTAADAFIRL
jgi:hypothetical protein